MRIDVYADHLRLLQRLEQLRMRAEEFRSTVTREIAATARTVKEACDTLSRASAVALRLVSAAQPFWEYDLLVAALVARGHAIELDTGATPHLVIDGVHATFEEAMAFHRGVVTLPDIEDRGAMSHHAPDGVASGSRPAAAALTEQTPRAADRRPTAAASDFV